MEAYLLHDANAGSNLKLMIMIQEEGMKGYGIYWTVLEFLRLQNEYKASLKVIPILAQKARVTTATLKRIIYDYALFEVNETSFSSPGLSRRMEPHGTPNKKLKRRPDVAVDWLTSRESGMPRQAAL